VTYDPKWPATPEQPSLPPDAPSSGPTPVAPVPTMPIAATAPVVAAPAPLPDARPKSSGGRIVNIILAVAVAVAIGGVAFAIGRTTAPAAEAIGPGGFGGGFANGSFLPNASGAPGFGGGRGGFGGGFGGAGLTIEGTVQSVSGDTVTIKTANGQTIEVTTAADTTYNTQAAGSASDVTDGATVRIQVTGVGGNGGFRPGASDAPTGPVGTAGSITVIP